MKRIVYTLAILCLLVSHESIGQFTLTGEINVRPEFRNGFKRPIRVDEDPAFFIEQRTRLYSNFKAEKYEVQITLQDVRIWGANSQVYKEENAIFGVVDGWARYYFTDAFSVKLGRQIISYDNQRYFGGLEWAMQGRRHDALLFLYEQNDLKLHVGGAFNQPEEPFEFAKLSGTNYPVINNYKHMQFLYLNKKWDDAKISLYLVNDGRQYGLTNDSLSAHQTYGLMGMKKFGDFTLNGEFFYQGGEFRGMDMNAFMYSVSGTLKTDLTPLTLGYDYLSGTDPNDVGQEFNSWEPSFGTNHIFYGHMDYFYVGNPHGGKGLQDFFLKTKFKVGKGSFDAHAHYFIAAADVLERDGATVASAGLGTEIDLIYVQKLAPEITWKLGYSQMFATDTMDLIKLDAGQESENFNCWAWTQIIFKPVLYKSDKDN